jgi:hypothetical protein
MAKFNAEIQQRLVTCVQSGILLATAASMVGISRVTLHNWLRSKHRKYKEFQAEMLKAQGYAAGRAELEVFKADPKFWLLCGPAREKYNPDGTVAEEGWAKPGTRPVVREPKPCACCGHVEGQPRPPRGYAPPWAGRRHPAVTSPPTAEEIAKLRDAFNSRMAYHARECRAAGRPVTNPVPDLLDPETYAMGMPYLDEFWAEWVANHPDEIVEGRPRTADVDPAGPANQPSGTVATPPGQALSNDANKAEGVNFVKNDVAMATARASTSNATAPSMKLPTGDHVKKNAEGVKKVKICAQPSADDLADVHPESRSYVAYLRACVRAIDSAASNPNAPAGANPTDVGAKTTEREAAASVT